jgi:hypothetical protein
VVGATTSGHAGMVTATLLSGASRWITAQNIEVAGGYDL